MTMPTTIDTSNAPPIRRPEIPTARRTAAIATERNSSTPWTTPQPIDPRTHSPIPSDVPMTRRKTAKTTSRKARKPSAAT